jgi:AcrR family transcriptional regulator
MAGPETKTRILEAAERLFAERGLASLSLRAVTGAAGVNLAAVNYHFGSKEGLVRALVRRMFAGVDAERLSRLDALEAAGDAPSVEHLLTAFATPIFTLFETHRAREWGQAWIASRQAERPRHGMPRGVTELEQHGEVTRRYGAALARALPHLPPEELAWRFERATNLLMANQGRSLMAPPGARPRDEERWTERARLITFLAGALRAPATVERPWPE